MSQSSALKQFLLNIRSKGFLHLMTANLFIQVFAFASQLFVAGILSPEDIGRIKIIQTYLAIFSLLSAMGFHASTLKICSENRSKEEVSNYFSSAIFFTIISSVIVYLIVILLNFFELFSKDTLIIVLMPLGMLPLIFNSFFSLSMSFFQAKKRIKLFSNLSVINKFLSILAIIALTWLWGIYGYYIAYNLSIIIMVAVIFLIIAKDTKINTKAFKKSLFRDHWPYARDSTISDLALTITFYIDIVFISLLIDDMREIGFYSFALTMCIALSIFPYSVQQITKPYFSNLKTNKEEFMKIFRRYNRMMYAAVLAILALFLLFVPPFVNFVFKGKYASSMNYLPYLAVGWSLMHVMHLKGAALFGLGKIKYDAYISLISLGVNLISYPILIYYLGLMGAAYASIISGVVMLSTAWYYFKKAVRETFTPSV